MGSDQSKCLSMDPMLHRSAQHAVNKKDKLYEYCKNWKLLNVTDAVNRYLAEVDGRPSNTKESIEQLQKELGDLKRLIRDYAYDENLLREQIAQGARNARSKLIKGVSRNLSQLNRRSSNQASTEETFRKDGSRIGSMVEEERGEDPRKAFSKETTNDTAVKTLVESDEKPFEANKNELHSTPTTTVDLNDFEEKKNENRMGIQEEPNMVTESKELKDMNNDLKGEEKGNMASNSDKESLQGANRNEMVGPTDGATSKETQGSGQSDGQISEDKINQEYASEENKSLKDNEKENNEDTDKLPSHNKEPNEGTKTASHMSEAKGPHAHRSDTSFTTMEKQIAASDTDSMINAVKIPQKEKGVIEDKIIVAEVNDSLSTQKDAEDPVKKPLLKTSSLASVESRPSISIQPEEIDLVQQLNKVESLLRESKASLKKKEEELAEMLCHKPFDIGKMDIVVEWPRYLRVVQASNALASEEEEKEERSNWNIITRGYEMERDRTAQLLLDEYNSGDIVKPPKTSHEDNGHTDDSASDTEDESDTDGEAAGSEAASTDNSDTEERADHDSKDKQNTKNEEPEPMSQALENPQDGSTNMTIQDASSSAIQSDEDVQKVGEKVGGESTLDQDTKGAGVDEEADTKPTTPNLDRLVKPGDDDKPDLTSKKKKSSQRKAKGGEPKVLKRRLPPMFDAALRSPVFFGYKLEYVKDKGARYMEEEDALTKKELAYFQGKIMEFKQVNQEKISQLQGKLRANTSKTKESSDKIKKKREEWTSRFEKAQETRVVDEGYRLNYEKEIKALDDELTSLFTELEHFRDSTETTISKILKAEEEDIKHITFLSDIYQCHKKKRINYHRAELDRLQPELEEAKAAVLKADEQYNQILLVIRKKNQEDPKVRSQVLFAESEVKSAQRNAEALMKRLEAEEFLLTRAKKRKKLEDLFLPFFETLSKCNEGTFSLLYMSMAYIFGCKGSQKEKVYYLFDLFRDNTSNLLRIDKLEVIIKMVLTLMRIIQDTHIAIDLTPQHIRSIALRVFLNLEFPPATGLPLHEFEYWCNESFQRSAYLCELFNIPWQFEHLGRFQTQFMSKFSQFQKGMITMQDLKLNLSKVLLSFHAELAPSKKEIFHERALAMGSDDPLKPDYSRFLSTDKIKTISNVVLLDHGLYKNIFTQRQDIMDRAAVRLQTQWRAKKGRQHSEAQSRMQSFYHSKGQALMKTREEKKKEWEEKSAYEGVQKMKFEAKLRMKQVKLRTNGLTFTREEVFGLMMDEDMQQALAEVEARYKEMEDEQGYTKMRLPGSDFPAISQVLIDQIVNAKRRPEVITRLLEEIKNKEESGAKGNEEKRKEEKLEMPEEDKATSDQEDELEKLFHVQQEQLSQQRVDNMIRGLFPVDLYKTGLTLEQSELKEELSLSDPSKNIWMARLSKLTSSMTALKIKELLLELPNKRLLCQYVLSFRRGQKQISMDDMIQDLCSHFRIIRESKELAECMVGILDTDVEYGLMESAVEKFQHEHEGALEALALTRVNEDAALSAKLLAKQDRAVKVASSHEQSRKESRQKRVKQVQEAREDLMKAHEIWRSAEMALYETLRRQTSFHANVIVNYVHRLNWFDRLVHAANLPEKTRDDVEVKYMEYYGIYTDFLEITRKVAVQIIAEHMLPLQDRVNQPVERCPIDGRNDLIRSGFRDRYEAYNISFQVEKDDHGLYDGSDENASKAAGNALRNSIAYSRCKMEHIQVPLQATVDYHGFRVLAVAKAPIDIVVVNEKGDVLRSYQDLVYGTNTKGKTIQMLSKPFDVDLSQAAVALNLARHGVRGLQDITTKYVSAAGDMKGFRGKKEDFYLLNYKRCMPPEDPDVTYHLSKSTRGNTIFWRQLRPEFVKQHPKMLSPDALSWLTAESTDWEEQAEGVALATKSLLEQAIPRLAEELCKRLNTRDIDITEEMHRNGINMRHLGLLRNKFCFKLSGTATLIFNSRNILTTEDFTREVGRGWRLWIEGQHYYISTEEMEGVEFGPRAITLDKVNTGPSRQGVLVYSSEVSDHTNSAELRGQILAEMVARVIKNILRTYLRILLRRTKLAMPHLCQSLVVQFLNYVSGSEKGSEEFWHTQVYLGILTRFGKFSVSPVERLNLRCDMLKNYFAYLLKRLQSFMGFQITDHCQARCFRQPNLFRFTIDDVQGDYCRTKHNMVYLNFSVASLLALQATLKQDATYSSQVLQDQPLGYWRLDERVNSNVAKNSGSVGNDMNGKYAGDMEYQVEGAIANESFNKAVEFPKNSQACIKFKENETFFFQDASMPCSMECWAKVTGGEGTNRVALTSGRYSLAALKGNTWCFTGNFHNIDVTVHGEQVAWKSWVHLVGTYDGTNLSLYINGKLAGQVDVISSIALRLRIRDEENMTRYQNIDDLEYKAKSKCWRRTESDAQDYFRTKEGQEMLKVITKQVQEEQNFRDRLAASSKRKESSSQAIIATAVTLTSTSTGKKMGKKEAMSLAKKQYIKKTYDLAIQGIIDEHNHARLKLKSKIEQELLEQSEKELRPLRIGCSCTTRQKSGRNFFVGQMCHVAIYPICLSRDRINCHFFLGCYPRESESNRLFEYASQHFARSISMASNDAMLLQKYAQNLCHSLNTDPDQFINESFYIHKIQQVYDYFHRTKNTDGIATILLHLPRKNKKYKDLFIQGFHSILAIEPNYFTATSVLTLKDLQKYPTHFEFLLPPVVASDVAVYAQIIRLVLAHYPLGFGTNYSDLSWVSQLTSHHAIVYFIRRVECEEDERILDLTCCAHELSGKDLELIVQKNKGMIQCNLSKCNLLLDDHFFAMAEKGSSLQVLDLSYCQQITDASIKQVARCCQDLMELNLAHCYHVTDFGVESIAKHCFGMRKLNVGYCDRITDDSLVTIGQNLLFLTDLSMAYCFQISNSSLAAFASMQKSPKLLHVNFAACRRISDEGICHFTRHLSDLISLNLFYCSKITDAGVSAITHNCLNLEELILHDLVELGDQPFYFDQEKDGRIQVDRNMLTKIRKIDIAECKKLSDHGLAGLCQRAIKIESINMSGCAKITDRGIQHMVVSALDGSDIGQHLMFLDISNCLELTERSFELLGERCTLLRSFHMNGCVQISEDCILRFIQKCTSIQSFGACYCRNITDRTLMYMAHHLYMEEIWLARCNRITDAGIVAVACELTGLENIDVSWCKNLTDSSIRTLLEKCKRLKRVNITDCRLLSTRVVEELRGANIDVKYSIQPLDVEERNPEDEKGSSPPNQKEGKTKERYVDRNIMPPTDDREDDDPSLQHSKEALKQLQSVKEKRVRAKPKRRLFSASSLEQNVDPSDSKPKSGNDSWRILSLPSLPSK